MANGAYPRVWGLREEIIVIQGTLLIPSELAVATYSCSNSKMEYRVRKFPLLIMYSKG